MDQFYLKHNTDYLPSTFSTHLSPSLVFAPLLQQPTFIYFCNYRFNTPLGKDTNTYQVENNKKNKEQNSKQNKNKTDKNLPVCRCIN